MNKSINYNLGKYLAKNSFAQKSAEIGVGQLAGAGAAMGATGGGLYGLLEGAFTTPRNPKRSRLAHTLRRILTRAVHGGLVGAGVGGAFGLGRLQGIASTSDPYTARSDEFDKIIEDRVNQGNPMLPEEIHDLYNKLNLGERGFSILGKKSSLNKSADFQDMFKNLSYPERVSLISALAGGGVGAVGGGLLGAAEGAVTSPRDPNTSVQKHTAKKIIIRALQGGALGAGFGGGAGMGYSAARYHNAYSGLNNLLHKLR